MNLQLLDEEENLLVEVKDLQNRTFDICTKLRHTGRGRVRNWDHACERASELEVSFPAVTGCLEADSAIAFIVATQPGNPQFIGVYNNTSGDIIQFTREIYAQFAIGDPVVYCFSRDNDSEPLQYLTSKQAEWVDTPPFSGMIYRKELDENGSERLTLTEFERSNNGNK